MGQMKEHAAEDGSNILDVCKGTTVRIDFEMSMPCAATRAQVLEWFSFELGFSSSCNSSNPLLGQGGLEAATEPQIKFSK